MTPEDLGALPKVLLHDHLDGGLRPETILDLAREQGYADLPSDDPVDLERWFRDSADSGSLERYLETFAHTVALMQTPAALHRVARECVLDLAEDGVVYAEVRYAPEQHLRGGLELDEVVTAVTEGIEDGMAEASRLGSPIVVRSLLGAMRHAARSREIAQLTVRHLERGVAGFDIAGAEVGFPPTRHLDAFEYLQRQNAHFTIHAGEAFGLPSIWEAIQYCGSERLGHGVRIVDDLTLHGDPVSPADTPYGSWAHDDVQAVRLGRLAAYIRDRRIALEMCPSSNLQTGAADSVAMHPITLLARLRFRVTLNTDNRLMSGTTMTREMQLLVAEAGWEISDLRRVTIDAMKSAFLPYDQRRALIDRVILPGYAQALD
ncbi:MAG TPA: adenosine deaminase [Ornithinimicrobium sp.]|uniref:adenosine deaminase n=1 Tax=Ornithinimicrobium sp. TaxID=1977084 RepID=UPI002B4AA6B5|nr:adenosine deaminase [Ornithinimicrobium sp.]HKJ12649.1 adenosine deaminase [Ornithinimicrobium sp.]